MALLKTESGEVAFADGASIYFTAKQYNKSSIREFDTGVEVTFYVKNGEYCSIILEKDHPLFRRFAAHGASQVIRDAGNKANDLPEVFRTYCRRIDELNNGQWSSAKTGLSRNSSKDIYAEALVIEREDFNFEEAKTHLAGLKDEDLKTVRSYLEATVQTLRAQRATEKAEKLNAAKSSVSVDNLLTK
jgi:hypothetical protein